MKQGAQQISYKMYLGTPIFKAMKLISGHKIEAYKMNTNKHLTINFGNKIVLENSWFDFIGIFWFSQKIVLMRSLLVQYHPTVIL